MVIFNADVISSTQGILLRSPHRPLLPPNVGLRAVAQPGLLARSHPSPRRLPRLASHLTAPAGGSSPRRPPRLLAWPRLFPRRPENPPTSPEQQPVSVHAHRVAAAPATPSRCSASTGSSSACSPRPCCRASLTPSSRAPAEPSAPRSRGSPPPLPCDPCTRRRQSGTVPCRAPVCRPVFPC